MDLCPLCTPDSPPYLCKVCGKKTYRQPRCYACSLPSEETTIMAETKAETGRGVTLEDVYRAQWELLVEWYRDGVPMTELSERTGITRSSLNRLFKRTDVYEPRSPGKKVAETCSQGHDKATYGRQEWKADGTSNGVACTLCKNERDKDRKR